MTKRKSKVAERTEAEQIADLAAAIREVAITNPLPRCKHGNAVEDHAGDKLAPSCGCTKCAHAVTERRVGPNGAAYVACKACGDWGPI